MRVYAFALIILLLAATSNASAPPSSSDADILALEISDSLLAPSEMISQIDQDLNAIHAAYPGWVHGVDYIHARADWIPGQIIVQMTTQGWTDYQNGVFTAFDNLNAQYGPPTISAIALPRTLLLQFPLFYHPVLLGSIYAPVAGIAQAHPNYLYGDGSDITSSQVGTYTFKRGWDDCPSGCIYEHFWKFAVTGGNVTLLDEYGSPTLAAVGDTPLVPSAVLLGNAPNPFQHTTTISFRVDLPAHVQMRVYDASGRLVTNLHEGPMMPGTYIVSWDGTDGAGRRAASGVYFCKLVAEGVAQTHKMLVIR